MPFAYYDRLSPARKAIYRRSDAIGTLGLPAGLRLGEAVAAMRVGLGSEDLDAVQHACQQIVDALCGGYRVPPIRVKVLAQRPADEHGELHGLYEPEEDMLPARISVWMRTAARGQVVAFKSFLRTLVHELCHHLDYELFALEETFHTEGFYKRESSVSSALLALDGASAALQRPPAARAGAAPVREPTPARNHRT